MFTVKWLKYVLPSNHWNESDKLHFRLHLDVELFIGIFRLAVADHDKESIAFEGLASAIELGFPVDFSGRVAAVSIQERFGDSRLLQAAKCFSRALVMIGNFLPNAGSDDFADAHALG